MYYMTFVENSDDKYKSELSLFPNDKGKIAIEMHPVGDEYDAYQYQLICLGRIDAERLMQELQRILSDFEISD